MDREVACKIPLPYFASIAQSGRVCAWAFPFNPSSLSLGSFLTSAATYYPFADFDCVGMFSYLFRNSATWPSAMFYSPFSLTNSTNLNYTSGTSNTLFPLSQRYLRVGCYYTYTVTNSGNTPLFVSPYKLYARRNLDKATYGTNILNEYISNLWNSGVATNVSGTLDEKTMVDYVHGNKYDFFDASSFCSQWKIKTRRPFVLMPGKSRAFSCKIRARSWSMREWFNDFPATDVPTASDCPWVRFKGVPEYVFKYTTGDGQATGVNYYPADTNPGLPEYFQSDIQPVGLMTLNYTIKYYVKFKPLVQPAFHATLGVNGFNTSGPSTLSLVDNLMAPTAAALA